MSYRGYVICRCFREGNTEKPPYADQLRFAEDGFYFETDSTTKYEPLFRKEAQLEQWKKKACEHSDMKWTQALIANDMGLTTFKNFLLKNGAERDYKNLLQLIDKVGKSPVYRDEAESVWEEIKGLKKRAQLTSTYKLVLREDRSHRIIMIGDYEDETFFAVLNNGHVFLLKNDAFYILDQNSNDPDLQVLFKASSFYTHTLGANRVEFETENQTQKIRTIRGLGEIQPNESKRQYTVHKETFNNYQYWKTIIDGLEKLLKASLETGHAILWEPV